VRCSGGAVPLGVAGPLKGTRRPPGRLLSRASRSETARWRPGMMCDMAQVRASLQSAEAEPRQVPRRGAKTIQKVVSFYLRFF